MNIYESHTSLKHFFFIRPDYDGYNAILFLVSVEYVAKKKIDWDGIFINFSFNFEGEWKRQSHSLPFRFKLKIRNGYGLIIIFFSFFFGKLDSHKYIVRSSILNDSYSYVKALSFHFASANLKRRERERRKYRCAEYPQNYNGMVYIYSFFYI